MTDLIDLPLFDGSSEAEQLTQKRGRPRNTRPALRQASVSSSLVALPLARNRQVVVDLVAMFQATPPGLHRAAAFRRDVLTPLVAPRIALGLDAQQVEAELNGLEEAMVSLMLAGQQRVGRRG